jgi:hypothetical protein
MLTGWNSILRPRGESHTQGRYNQIYCYLFCWNLAGCSVLETSGRDSVVGKRRRIFSAAGLVRHNHVTAAPPLTPHTIRTPLHSHCTALHCTALHYTTLHTLPAPLTKHTTSSGTLAQSRPPRQPASCSYKPRSYKPLCPSTAHEVLCGVIVASRPLKKFPQGTNVQ